MNRDFITFISSGYSRAQICYARMYVGQGEAHGSWSSPSTMQIPGIDPVSLALVTGVFPCRAILLAWLQGFFRYIRFLRLQQQSTTHQVAKLLSHGSGGGKSETQASQGWLLLRVWEKLPMLQPLLWWLTASLPCLICGASLTLGLHLHDILLGCPSQCFWSLSLWGYQSACIREHSNGLFLNWGSVHLNSK